MSDTERRKRKDSRRSRKREEDGPSTYRQSDHRRAKKHAIDVDREDRRPRRAPASPPSVSRLPHAHFGDDLLRAERFESRLAEERTWSAKLGGIQHDDQRGAELRNGSDEDAAWEEELRRMRGDSDAKPSGSDSSRSSARDQSSSDAPCSSDRWRQLNDEEYAAYMRDGMYRRKNAASIAFDEERRRRWDKEQEQRSEGRKRKHAAREEKKQRHELVSKQRAVEAARQEWDAAWKETSGDGRAWTLASVPWPVLQEDKHARVSSRIALDIEAVRFFLFAHDSQAQGTQRLRSALLRFHPDRFFSSQRFTRIESASDSASIRRHVHTVSQILSEIVDDRRA